jgi:hypothetical protein
MMIEGWHDASQRQAEANQTTGHSVVFIIFNHLSFRTPGLSSADSFSKIPDLIDCD